MKNFLKLALLMLMTVAAKAQANQPAQGFCSTGGQTVKTSGMSSSNTVLATYPKCLVNVYITGTLTPATIYKDAIGTPLGNPFIANDDASWLFYGAKGVGLDVTMTGGLPVAFPRPFTLVGIFPGQGSGGTSLPGGTGVVKVDNSVPGLAAYPNIVNLFGGGTCIGYLNSSGTCSTSTSGGAGNKVTQIQRLGPGQALSYSPATADIDGNINANQYQGYKRNRYSGAVAINSVLQSTTARPDDACPTSSNGLIDAGPCFNRQITQLVYLNGKYNNKTLVIPGTPGQTYYLGKANYLINLARDIGDYSNSAGFQTPATVTLNLVAGQLTSCSVAGGLKYAPSGKIPVKILDPTYQGSGANANITTDASGTPTGCVVTSAGMNYPAIGVQANVIPLGGDGASASFSLSGGVPQNGSVVISTPGSGYSSSVLPQLWIPGLSCSVLPSQAAGISNASVSAVTFTGGSGCTFGGNANATNIPIFFGAVCGGGQCHNIDPQPPVQLGCSVAVRTGIQIVGIGNPIIVTDSYFNNYITVDTTQVVPFCDPWGDQTESVSSDNPFAANQNLPTTVRISGLDIRSWIPIWFSGMSDSVEIDHNSFNCLFPGYMAGASIVTNFTSALPYNAVYIHDNKVLSWADWVFGNGWDSRNPATGGGGNFGGIQIGHPSRDLASQYWGKVAGIVMNNNVRNSITGVNDAGYAKLDQFYEKYIWQSQNSPATFNPSGKFALLSNGSTSCVVTQTNASRATDWTGAGNLYPYYMCMPQIATAGVSILPRFYDGNLQNAYGRTISIDHYHTAGTNSAAVNILFAWNVWLNDITVDNGVGVAPANPYLPSGATNHAIEMFGPSPINAYVQDVVRSRGFYSDGLQVRQANAASPFLNSAFAHNVFGITNQNFPLPFITTPLSTALCTTGIMATGSDNNLHVCLNSHFQKVTVTAESP